MSGPRRAVIALGSNMGDSVEILKSAVASIAQLPQTRLLDVSRLYATKPVGGPEQADFLNAAVLVESDLDAEELLDKLHGIEAAAGRVRDVVWGPRTLDLDLIDVENVVSDRANLQIPHPRAHERQFVVHPMQDVAPQWSLRGVPLSHWVTIDDDVKVFADCGWSAS